MYLRLYLLKKLIRAVGLHHSQTQQLKWLTGLINLIYM